MGKYDRLGAWLREQGGTEIPVTFSQIERIVGVKLPASQKHQAWWSNSTSNNVMTQVWLDAGYRTEQVDVAGRKLVFRRVADAVRTPHPLPRGMKDEARMFTHRKAVADAAQTPRRSPLFGAMKGTFTIEPGYDLTSPVYNDKEWAGIEKEMQADWDQIEQGLTGKHK